MQEVGAGREGLAGCVWFLPHLVVNFSACWRLIVVTWAAGPCVANCERAPLQQWSTMGHSLTPLSSHVLDSLAVASIHASSSKLPLSFCWVHSVRDSTGDRHFKTLECDALSSRGSCKSKLSHKQVCRWDQIVHCSSRLQAWPNVSCSVAFSSEPTTLPSKPEPLPALARNSASRSFLLQEAAELPLPNAPEGKALVDVPLEGDLGKVFVGNLPYHIKREAVKEFFSQCGPVRDIIFIRSHSDPEKNKGYCFLFFGGSDPNASAIRAADLDGAEFFGKLLRVRIDDGRWERDRREQRERWIESGAVRRILCCCNVYFCDNFLALANV